MPLYICRWQNGDFSAVYARNREDAIIKLDEVDNAEVAELFPTKNFMVHFKLLKEVPEDIDNAVPVELEEFGDETIDVLADRVYPVYQKAVMNYDRNWKDSDHPTEEEGDAALKSLNEALITERKRNWGQKREKFSDDPDAARLQREGHRIPKALAERVVKEHRRKKIEEIRDMPPSSDKIH